MEQQFVWRNETTLWVNMPENKSWGGYEIRIDRSAFGKYTVGTTGTHMITADVRLYAAGLVIAAEQADRLAKREQANADAVKVGDFVSFEKNDVTEIGTVEEVFIERMMRGVTVRYERDGKTCTRSLEMHEFEIVHSVGSI